ncbi:MAG: hypothetical protein ACRCZP_17615 [Phycicoccus sp.]
MSGLWAQAPTIPPSTPTWAIVALLLMVPAAPLLATVTPILVERVKTRSTSSAAAAPTSSSGDAMSIVREHIDQLRRERDDAVRDLEASRDQARQLRDDLDRARSRARSRERELLAELDDTTGVTRLPPREERTS